MPSMPLMLAIQILFYLTLLDGFFPQQQFPGGEEHNLHIQNFQIRLLPRALKIQLVPEEVLWIVS